MDKPNSPKIVHNFSANISPTTIGNAKYFITPKTNKPKAPAFIPGVDDASFHQSWILYKPGENSNTFTTLRPPIIIPSPITSPLVSVNSLLNENIALPPKRGRRSSRKSKKNTRRR